MYFHNTLLLSFPPQFSSIFSTLCPGTYILIYLYDFFLPEKFLKVELLGKHFAFLFYTKKKEKNATMLL